MTRFSLLVLILASGCASKKDDSARTALCTNVQNLTRFTSTHLDESQKNAEEAQKLMKPMIEGLPEGVSAKDGKLKLVAVSEGWRQALEIETQARIHCRIAKAMFLVTSDVFQNLGTEVIATTESTMAASVFSKGASNLTTACEDPSSDTFISDIEHAKSKLEGAAGFVATICKK